MGPGAPGKNRISRAARSFAQAPDSPSRGSIQGWVAPEACADSSEAMPWVSGGFA